MKNIVLVGKICSKTREEFSMTDDNKKCAHKMCRCMTSGDSQYCSQHCEDTADQDLTEISCDCGHPGCA